MKEQKVEKLRWWWIAAVVIGCLVILFFSIYSNETAVYGATCPGKSNSTYAKQTEWQCGCTSCGGSVWYHNEVDRYSAPDRSDRGSGLNSRLETEASGTTWKVYYRCDNCGDTGYNCKEWEEEVYRVYVSTTNNSLTGTLSRYTEDNPFTGYAEASRAAGYIPWYYCSFCDKWGDGRELHNDCPTIKVSVSPADGGSVAIAAESIIGNICAPGSSVELIATGAGGFVLENWSTGSAEYKIKLTMNTSMDITAFFKEEKQVPAGSPGTGAPLITAVPDITEAPGITEAPSITEAPQVCILTYKEQYYDAAGYLVGETISSENPHASGAWIDNNSMNITSRQYNGVTYYDATVELGGTNTGLTLTLPKHVHGNIKNNAVVLRKFYARTAVVTPGPTNTPASMPTSVPTNTPTPMPTSVPVFQVMLDAQGATSTNHTKKVSVTLKEYGPDISVPEKNGYQFAGYFTEARGGGTKYYDAEGTCIKPWTELSGKTLYAYWIQLPVKLPEEAEYKEPECLPELVIEGDVKRNDAKALLYADDYNTATGALNDLQPYLTYDVPGAQGVIPGTELLSFRARVPSWRLKYRFQRYSGTDLVKIIVTVPYRTQYELANADLVISDKQTKTYSFLVPKAWSYWGVVESGLYYPDKVTVTNDALLKKEVVVEVKSTENYTLDLPEYAVIQRTDKKEHVKWPEYDSEGVPVLYLTLDKEEYIISEKTGTLPEIDSYLSIVCKNAAWNDKREASVRSDSFIFDGETILSDEWQSKNGSEVQKEKLSAASERIKLTSYVQTYASGIELNDLQPNGKYATTAVISYTGSEKNVGASATWEEKLSDINALNIHTPVACNAVVAAGSKAGVLVLKEPVNPITVRIDNVGTHRLNLGYGTKNYAKALSGKSNIAMQGERCLNQVKFPFAVYKENTCISAETWITIGNQEAAFQIPVTQKNGTYQLEFRTIAVNCPKRDEKTYETGLTGQAKVNTIESRYIATDSIELEIRSYLESFSITGTNDPAAEQKLLKGNQALVLKKGYYFNYELLTKGEFYGNNTKWSITPRFYWISSEESERQEVELYRAEYLTAKEQRECYAMEGVLQGKEQENSSKILQRFFGSGCIPEDVLCVPVNMKQEFGFSLEEYLKMHTITGKEEFFKQNGYLVLHFDIQLKSEEGVWYTFDNWENTQICKDAVAAGWKYVPGDVIRYNLAKSVAEDYEVGGVE